MKTYQYLLLIILMVSFQEVFSQASSSASVNTRARVIEPIKIDKTVDLDFGNVINAYTSGSVVLSPDGTRVAYGVQISNSFPGNVTPAEAVVTHGNNSYSISLPESFTLYNQENPSQSLVVDEFTVAPEEGGVTDIIKIGGRLNMDANQVSGYYTNSSGFNVTVSYN